MTSILTSTILAVTIALSGATGPADDAETTAVPQTAQGYRLPDEVAGSLVYNPLGVGTYSHAGREPVLELVERTCGGRTDITPNLTIDVIEPFTMDDPDGTGQVVVQAGEYPGYACQDVSSELRIVHPDHGVADPSQAAIAWTDEQVTAMIDAAGQTATVVSSTGDLGVGEVLTLRADPGNEGEPLVVLTEGMVVEAGLPVDLGPHTYGNPLSPSWVPVRVDGYTGWMAATALRPAPAGGLDSLGVESEEVLVGTVAAMTDRQGIAVYALDRGTDWNDPALRQGTVLTYLQPGDQVTASREMWETVGAGGGWLAFAVDQARISELPSDTQYLGSAGRIVELDDGRVGWAYAYLTLDAEALTETAAPTTEPQPTDAVPTIGAPDPTHDQATVTAAPAVDPMSVPIGAETVTRRGNRAGVPSTFPIATGPSPEHPVIGKLTEGTNYPASLPFEGVGTLQGSTWRAIEVLNEDGEVTRAFVRDADVLVVPNVTDAEPPPLDPTWTDLVVGKGTELTEAGVERWEGRERGAWNPFRSLTRTLAYAVAIPIALAAGGLLALGGYRASVVASGRRTRAGITPVGRLLAVAPTTLGATLAVVAAWLMPGTTVGWVVTGLLAALAGAVVMTRLSSRRAASLTPDLTGATWDRLVLSMAPGLVVGALAWWLLGVMPAVVLAAVGLGAGVAMAGARVDQDDEQDEPAEPSEPEQVSVPGEASPSESPAADPYDLSETSQSAGPQPGQPAD